MAIVNNFIGFKVATQPDYNAADNDSDFGENLNRSIKQINQSYNYTSAIKNTYVDGFINQFGASSAFSTNEQRLVQNMVRESININGITVRYMPRWSPYTDRVWNERPESRFHRGLPMDMMLVAAAGFEGEGDVMTQYGMEFREEVILTIAIPRFEELYSVFTKRLNDQYDSEDAKKFERTRPLEGDLIAVAFGRSAQNKNQYAPKIFEILRVTTYHDGAFFQLGNNYQYKIRARLFELSGEDLEFNPTVVQYNPDGSQLTIIDSETGPIARSKDPLFFLDSDTRTINTSKDSEMHFDSWSSNRAIEERAKQQEVFDNYGTKVENVPVIVQDYGAQAFGVPGIIDDLDNI
jgi:hypothetical protein